MDGKEDLPGVRLGDRYQVNLEHLLPDIGGCPAYPAQNLSGAGGSCLAFAPSFPSPYLSEFAALRHDALMPIHALEYDVGALWVICGHPPGPSLTAGFPVWAENQIIDGAVRPLAGVLSLLQSAGMTARSIRPDNLFVGNGGTRLVLAPLGLATPALGQPLVFEPLSSAFCDPPARGKGTISCDVFSLGVLVLALCMGEIPLTGLSDEEILARRLRLGSADAYIGDFKVPDGLNSLIRAMLADDATRRPSPRDLITMTSGKIFSLRPEMPARIPLQLGNIEIWTPRALAWHAMRHPSDFSALLQRQVVANWLRNELRQRPMAAQIEQMGGVFLPAADKKNADPASLALMHIISILDPGAPMFWGGRWFWPDALPSMLAHAAHMGEKRQHEERDLAMIAGFLLGNLEVFEHPVVPQSHRAGVMALLTLGQHSGAKGTERVRRLPYDSNIHQPCLSPRCLNKRVSEIIGILAWANKEVESDSLSLEAIQKNGLLDEDIRSFLTSRFQRLKAAIGNPVQRAGLPAWNRDLALLAIVQRKGEWLSAAPVINKVLPLLKSELRHWRSKTAREKRRTALEKAVEEGNLTTLLQIVEDPHGLRADAELAQRAEMEIAHLVNSLDQDPETRMQHNRLARNAGEFVSLIAGIGVAMTSVWLEFCQ